MANIFIKKPNIIGLKSFSFLSGLRGAEKKIQFRTFSEDLDGANEPEILRDIQVKPKAKEFSVTTSLSDGKELIICSGKLAKFADGAATVTYNNATVMATAVSKLKSSSTTFTPLTVVFQQKAGALGRIPMNFLRRELGQNEYEVLTSRMIDRSVRPLFPHKFNWDTQIVCTPVALNGNVFPDVLAINAASAALAVSDIPWNGPTAAVRVGLINDNVIINPDKKELGQSTVNLVVVSKERKFVVMLEGSFGNANLNDVRRLIKVGTKECQKIISGINSLVSCCGKKKRPYKSGDIINESYQVVKTLCEEDLREIFSDFGHDKLSRDEAVMNVYSKVIENVKENHKKLEHEVEELFGAVCKNVFRDLIFEKNVRCDGRSLNMLRNIDCEVDVYKPLHGSAVFQRGQTQVLCTVALDSPNSAMKMDRVSMLTSGMKEKNFFVHYEFPPFATKEVGRIGPIGRREIGHGALAEKALRWNIPENYPFTIRLTSEVLESNGSSSMATVCGGSLALMDAGVPLKNPCAGVAMGVITKWSDEEVPDVVDYRILTDLLGIEDYMGDMDFKIAGTKKHITALQMDVKTAGLPLKIIMESLSEGKIAIGTVLNEMTRVCAGPRTKPKDNWPVMEKVTVPINLRSKFIGPSGLNIKRLEMNAGVEITEDTAGEFQVFAPNQAAMKEASEVMNALLEAHKEPTLEFGGVYMATVVEIKEHGCLVTLYPNMQPVLIHVTQLDQRKISHPSVLGIKVGQKFHVKYFGRDPVSGLMRLSKKVLQTTGPEVAKSYFKTETEETEVDEKRAAEGSDNK